MLRSSNLSKSQIDRLGDRLRKGNVSQDDLRLLDTYRLSFGDAYKEVVAAIRRLAPTFEGKSLLEPTGREAKSTPSIIAKLQRESIRLSEPGLKYGTGDAGALKVLAFASAQIQILEAEEQLANTMLSTEVQREVDEHGRVTRDLKSKILQVMERMKLRRE